ncbi:MAG TPA: YoaK family protein [Daejeonella sp.]|nr:YoaK family protein [Daejeonella sp.]
MLRHRGQRRTYPHNLRLAALLCSTAGFVNGAGFLAFAVLTTNVTGHVALFAKNISQGDFRSARIVGLWMLLFLLGAFVCSLLVGKIGRHQRYAYVIPISIEISILLFIAIYGYKFDKTILQVELFAGSLLFAMGLQNAMVTMISGAVVRTTHLTGMFTDLGIELSALLYSKLTDKKGLKQKIILRTVIISFFIAGGILGAYLFTHITYSSFFIPVAILVFTMFYDIFRVHAVKMARRIKRNVFVSSPGKA